MLIREAISTLVEHRDLAPQDAVDVMTVIMDGKATQAEIGGFLIALHMKGETPAELAAFARVLRDHAVTVRPTTSSMLVDTCGTGGDGAKTFNISTASAFVAAGAGVPVVKHGNRSVSSRCGSADVLTALGIRFPANPARQAEIVERIGISFFFAPSHHPAMKFVMAARQELGCRTVFNILGPLANPAGAQAQVLGVYTPELTPTMAEVLRILGLSRAMVVHGSSLDEITTTGETAVAELCNNRIRSYRISPESYGIERAALSDISGGDPDTNARIIREVLDGETGAPRDIVLMNAGAAIYVGGHAHDLMEGICNARESIDTGNARSKLDALVEATMEAA